MESPSLLSPTDAVGGEGSPEHFIAFNLNFTTGLQVATYDCTGLSGSDAMLNDVRPPPAEPKVPVEGNERLHHALPHAESLHKNGAHHLHPHIDATEPGKHHSRYMGDIPTTTDPIYAMPFEDRGSGFNIAMSVVTLLLFGVLIVAAWWTLG